MINLNFIIYIFPVCLYQIPPIWISLVLWAIYEYQDGYHLYIQGSHILSLPAKPTLIANGNSVQVHSISMKKIFTFFTRGQLWPSGIVVACVCLCVCVSVNHQFVRTITCHPLKLQSPNLDQKCKTPWLRSLLFLGFTDLDLQGQIELKSQNLPHFGLVSLSGRQVNTKWSEAFQIWTKNAP